MAQEALARAYRSFGRLRERARFRAWLVRISWRLALDHRRAATRRARREQETSVVPDPPGVEEVVHQNEFQDRLWQAVAEEADAAPAAPVLRSFSTNAPLILRDGQSTVFSESADPITGETLKTEVTLHVVK